MSEGVEMVQVPRHEWEALKDQVADLREIVSRPAPSPMLTGSVGGLTGRRGLLKHGALLAAGAVAGGGVLAAAQASPAAASTGGFQYGATNNSLSDPTTLYSSSDNYTLSLINTGNGQVLEVGDNGQGTGAGLAVGMGNSENESPGVQIYCEGIGDGLDSTVISGPGTAILGTVSFNGLGTAVAGEITNLSNHSPVIYASTASGPGLVAYAGGSYRGVYGQSNSGAGVYGFSSDGPGVQAQSSTERGVHGTSTSATGVFGESSTGHAVEGQITNPASAAYALHGVTTGTGSAIVGQVNNPASTAAGLAGVTNGIGPSIGAIALGSGAALAGLVYGTGPALLGQIANAANSQPAVSGSTAGTGPAVQGQATGNGIGLNASSVNGRGAVLAGGAAQAKLVPSAAATHPTSGQAGDLFVDKSARLWLCTVTGTSATWKQVQVA